MVEMAAMALRFSGFLVTIGVGLVAGAACAQAQAPQPQPAPLVYQTQASCMRAHTLSPSDCANAFSNAKAELEEKAPRFTRRAECEKYFKRCQITNLLGGRKVELGPTLKGVEISPPLAGARTVLPLLEAGAEDLPLVPRLVSTPDTKVAPDRRAQALEAWKQTIEARNQAAFPTPGADATLPPAPR
jgi:hypothetical protein